MTHDPSAIVTLCVVSSPDPVAASWAPNRLEVSLRLESRWLTFTRTSDRRQCELAEIPVPLALELRQRAIGIGPVLARDLGPVVGPIEKRLARKQLATDAGGDPGLALLELRDLPLLRAADMPAFWNL